MQIFINSWISVPLLPIPIVFAVCNAQGKKIENEQNHLVVLFCCWCSHVFTVFCRLERMKLAAPRSDNLQEMVALL